MDSIWNDTTQELLVEYVELFPDLWDQRCETYNQKNKTLKRWNRIGSSLGCSGEEARKEFNKLRKQFSRYLEKLGKDSSRSGRPFHLTEKMLFLLVPDCYEFPSPEMPIEERPPQSDMSDIYEEFLDSSDDTCSSTQLTEGSAASSENLTKCNNTTINTKLNQKLSQRFNTKIDSHFEIRKLNLHRKRRVHL